MTQIGDNFYYEGEIMSFSDDLERGGDGEAMVLELLRKKYPSAVRIPNKFSFYDIWIPEIGKSIEVKCDFKSCETGNIVIEVAMYGKPSGLLVTKADFWVFYDGERLVKITPQKIFEFIILEKCEWLHIIGAGDSVKKKAYLLPKAKFFKQCDEIEWALGGEERGGVSQPEPTCVPEDPADPFPDDDFNGYDLPYQHSLID